MKDPVQHAASYSNFLVLIQAAALHLGLTFFGLLIALVLGHSMVGLGIIGVGTVVIVLWAIGRLRSEGL